MINLANAQPERNNLKPTSVGGGVHRGDGGGRVETHIKAGSEVEVGEKAHAMWVDGDGNGRVVGGGEDLERDGGGVRVDYGIERREERLPTGGS